MPKDNKQQFGSVRIEMGLNEADDTVLRVLHHPVLISDDQAARIVESIAPGEVESPWRDKLERYERAGMTFYSWRSFEPFLML